MLVLLAALPYAVATAANWLIVGQAFRTGDGGEAEPGIRNALLLAPVAIGGLTPMALVARRNVSGSDRALLSLAAILAVAFTVLLTLALSDTDRALSLQKEVAFGRVRLSRIERWQVVLVIGSVLLLFGAVANIIVAGD
jgi:hypothetical protein